MVTSSLLRLRFVARRFLCCGVLGRYPKKATKEAKGQEAKKTTAISKTRE
jgi:hypothetical protein